MVGYCRVDADRRSADCYVLVFIRRLFLLSEDAVHNLVRYVVGYSAGSLADRPVSYLTQKTQFITCDSFRLWRNDTVPSYFIYLHRGILETD